MDIQWPLAIFSLLAGCGGGILAMLAVGELLSFGKKARFPLAIAALAVIVVGGCCSVAHLGNPANIMAAAANIGSLSGISVELIFLGASVIFGAVYAIAVKREAPSSALKVLAVIAGVLGFVLAFVTGNGYVMESQANWNTPLLPLCYLASGLTMGVSVYACALVAKPDDDETSAGKALAAVLKAQIALAVVELVLFVVYDAVCGFAGNPVAFWLCAVVVGSIGVGACAYAVKKDKRVVYAGAACAVIGGIGFRCAMWLMGSGFLTLFTTIAGRGVLGV